MFCPAFAGESLPDLEEMKARSASFAAALAEAEAIAAEVNMSMEAAKQQQAATAAAEVSAAGRLAHRSKPGVFVAASILDLQLAVAVC